MGGAQCDAQFLERSSQGLLDATLCYRSARSSVLLLLALLSLLRALSSSLLSLSVSCSWCVHGLKPLCLTTARFHFLPPSDRLLLFTWNSMSSVSSSTTHRKWPLVPLQTVPALPRRFGSSVTLGNDSSTTSIVKLDLKFLCIGA